MLIGSGRIVEVIESRVKPFGRVLSDYASKGFTGYVSYKNVNQGVYVTIAVLDGHVVACRAVGKVAVIFSPVEREVLYEGVECGNAAAKYLYVPEGIVEVVEVARDYVLLDTLIFPLARVEERTALEVSLATEVVAGIRERAQPLPTLPAPPPRLPPQEEAPAPPRALPVETAPQLEAKPKKPELKLSDECIDPLTLYTVLKSSQLLEVIRETVDLSSLLEKLNEIVARGGISYVYATGSIGDGTVRVLYDPSTSTARVEVERGSGTVCGGKAVKDIESERVSSARIWVIQA